MVPADDKGLVAFTSIDKDEILSYAISDANAFISVK